MSKLVAATVATAGAAAASVGGTYLLQKSGAGTVQAENKGNKDAKTTNQPVATPLSNVLDFQTLNDFRTKNGGSCAQKYFEKLSYGTSEGKQISATETIQDADFSKTASAGENPKGCLVINWERTDSKDTVSTENKKWKGNFRWLWSFVNGDKGFVIFSTTKLSKQEKQLDLEGGIYFLSQEGTESNKTWKIQKHKEISDTSKNITDGNFDNSFPKVGDNLDGTETSKSHWGFVSGKGDLEKLCKEGDTSCPQDPKDNKSESKLAWEWSTDTSKTPTTPDKWSASFYENLKGLFGEDGLSHLENAFNEFKGHWKMVNPSNEQQN